MAKITDLLEAGNLDGSNAVPVVKGGVTRRATLGGVVAAVATPFVAQAQPAANAAEGLIGKTFRSKAEGERATVAGQLFAVDRDDDTVIVYLRTAVGSDFQREVMTSEGLGTDTGHGSTKVKFRRSISAFAVARTIADKAMDQVSFLDFAGSNNNGTGCNSEALNDAIAELSAQGGGIIWFPIGKYRFTKPIIWHSKVYLLGAGRGGSEWISEVIGDSLLKIGPDGLDFFGITGFEIRGNGLTGAAGNGHAIDLIDPNINNSTHFPQQGYVADLYIHQFKGRGREETGVMDACGMVQIDGLGIDYSNIVINKCGQGGYFRLCQNTHLYNVVVDKCSKYGLVFFDTENVTATSCDVVNCGDGLPAVAWPVAGALSANIWTRQNEGLVLFGLKSKGTKGRAQMVNEFDAPLVEGCWFQLAVVDGLAPPAIYSRRPTGAKYLSNWFSPTYNVERLSYNIVEIENDGEAPASFIAEGNVIEIGNFNIASFLKLVASGSSRPFKGCKLSYNTLNPGPASISDKGMCTINAFISLAGGTLDHSEIIGNTGTIPAGCTVTTFIERKVEAALGVDVTVRGNSATVLTGGTLGTLYSPTITPQQIVRNGLQSSSISATGKVLVTHSLGMVPSYISVTSADRAPRHLSVSQDSGDITTTTFQVFVFDAAGAALTSGSASFYWEAKGFLR